MNLYASLGLLLLLSTSTPLLAAPSLQCRSLEGTNRSFLRVIVDADTFGRQIAQVYRDDDMRSRMILQIGVEARAQPGHEYDLVYSGRNFVMEYSSAGQHAVLETSVGSEVINTYLNCSEQF